MFHDLKLSIGELDDVVVCRFTTEMRDCDKLWEFVRSNGRVEDGEAGCWFYGQLGDFYLNFDEGVVKLVRSYPFTSEELLDGVSAVEFDVNRAWLDFVEPLRKIHSFLTAN